MRFFFSTLLTFLGCTGILFGVIVSLISGVTSFVVVFPLGAICIWLGELIAPKEQEYANMDGVNPRFGRE